jgi:hypothetical protein
MEFKAPEYFYALAQLSMAFVGFGAIVATLRQSIGKPLSSFQVFLTRIFIESGLLATAFAMLAPTLAMSGESETTVWRIASAIMLVVLTPWVVAYPIRRKASSRNAKLPARVYVMFALGIGAIIAVGLNTIGLVKPSPIPLAIATIYVLAFASVAFLSTYKAFLRD